MRFVDLIEKKKQGLALCKEEIQEIISSYVSKKIPDYQMSAFLMAICFQGLDDQETFALTKAMMHSGDIIDLSKIQGFKVDKHSTGGVGDKTSLVLAPLLACCDVKVAKMSGRGLGFTGGTLDKLESIPGYRIDLSQDEFVDQVNHVGAAIIGQSQNLVPADKMLYALRDVTATVDNPSLIASSIMSKKLACGSDAIFLDVKYGQGAFMKTKQEAYHLASLMMKIGKHFSKETRATISSMNQPLGYAIGNSLEVIEAVETLKGRGPQDFRDLCLHEASLMLMMAHGSDDYNQAYHYLQTLLKSQKAFEKLKEMVTAQGGQSEYLDDLNRFEKPKCIYVVNAMQDGYIASIDARVLGIVSMKLGGGRMKHDQDIDHRVGLILHHKVGDYLLQGEPLITVYANQRDEDLDQEIFNAYRWSNKPVSQEKLMEEVQLGG